ncbi:RNA pseudouridine synthase [bacterium]|nr:RNA pseudouridine synthase [bacterium]
MEPQVVFSDKDLIAAVKPAGMPSQPDPSGALSLLEWLQARFGSVFVLNRLDRPVGGLLIFAGNSEAAARLNRLISERNFRKYYLALLERPEKLASGSEKLENYLLKDGRSNLSRIVGADTEGAKRAELEYRILKTGRTRALAAISLLTGRHHQIRAQFAHLGCPVAGDVKYGASGRLRGRGIALWSWRLGFVWKGRSVNFVSLPSGKTWEPFLEAAPGDGWNGI